MKKTEVEINGSGAVITHEKEDVTEKYSELSAESVSENELLVTCRRDIYKKGELQDIQFPKFNVNPEPHSRVLGSLESTVAGIQAYTYLAFIFISEVIEK